MALEWKHLTYTVPVGRGKKKTTKTILDRLSGVAPPGHLLAIMGPTGNVMATNMPQRLFVPSRACKTVLRMLSTSLNAGCCFICRCDAHAGSGKTSLVNALAGRLAGGALKGSVLVNGRDRRKNFRNISA